MSETEATQERDGVESEWLRVEVAYALPDRQRIVKLQVASGTTAREAAERASLQAQFPEFSLDDSTPLGIFGKTVPQSQILTDGDRVEVYRPLIADPKEARRARAQRARAARDGA